MKYDELVDGASNVRATALACGNRAKLVPIPLFIFTFQADDLVEDSTCFHVSFRTV
jgi:hypothetical protein